jgi:uroporphyrinogen decarboxylase
MNNKEIILAGIHLEKTPRPPVMILSGGVWANNRIELSLQDTFDIDPKIAAQNMIMTNELVQSDLIWTAAGCNNLALRGIGAKATFENVGVAAGIDEPLITCADDVDKLNIDDMENDKGIIAMLEATHILSQEVGDKTLIGISQWGPMTLAGLLLGTENFMVMSIREKEATNYILEFTEKLVVKYWKLFAQAGAQLVSQAEPSASCDMISPKQFKKMALPHIQNTNKAIDGLVKAKMLHICGNITKILDFMPLTGSDVISFDYKVSLTEAREKLGGKMAFAGKLDPVSAMQLGTTDEIRALTKDYIQESGSEGGYIVMPGCDLPPATPLENVQAMVDVARNYKY